MTEEEKIKAYLDEKELQRQEEGQTKTSKNFYNFEYWEGTED